MKRTSLQLALSFFLITSVLTLPSAVLPAPLDDEAFIKVAEKVGPSVVTISGRIAKEFNSTSSKLFEGTASGSGFIIDDKGYIITNRHVVQGMRDIAVKLADGREFEASLVNIHPTMDTALIKIKNPPSDLVPAKLGDSSSLRVGQWVAAIGAPFGFANTLTKGIISALNRPAELFANVEGGTLPSYNFIQHDAAVNPGNSGGPLVNLQDEVIGINTLIASPQKGSVGLSFAIPINAVKDALPKLRSAKKASVGWIGAKTQKLDQDLRAQLKIPASIEGLIVSSVEKRGPAHTAGLKELDVILEVEKEKYSDPLLFEQFVQNQDTNKELALQVLRKGKILTIKVKVAVQK